MRKPLEQGTLDGDYPVNDQSDPDFNVGGVERILPDELQFEQISSYMDATYPRPSETEDLDRYLALLPDRLTHAAMLMLGSAVDHTMPGVAFVDEIEVESTEFGPLFRPPHPTGVWVVACGPRSPRAREFAWQPEVAAAAELSGAVALDVRREDVEAAIAFARERGASDVVVWLYRQRFDTSADRAIYSFPPDYRDIPESALVQVPAGTGAFTEYHSTGEVSTPTEARRRIRDVATFLSSVSTQ